VLEVPGKGKVLTAVPKKSNERSFESGSTMFCDRNEKDEWLRMPEAKFGSRRECSRKADPTQRGCSKAL